MDLTDGRAASSARRWRVSPVARSRAQVGQICPVSSPRPARAAGRWFSVPSGFQNTVTAAGFPAAGPSVSIFDV
eukprot:11223185-Lingulodinium_polyedra.AAC.1